MASVPAQHFEAKLHAYRRTQEGAVISFVVHPDELKSITDITIAPFGTRFVVALAEINDDETPASANGRPSDFDSENSGSNPEAGANAPVAQRTERSVPDAEVAGSTPAGCAKPRRKFDTLPLSQQCAMRCGEKRFQKWLRETFSGCSTIETATAAADAVRTLCAVSSRSELDAVERAANEWRWMDGKFQQWLLETEHADLAR